MLLKRNHSIDWLLALDTDVAAMNISIDDLSRFFGHGDSEVAKAIRRANASIDIIHHQQGSRGLAGYAVLLRNTLVSRVYLSQWALTEYKYGNADNGALHMHLPDAAEQRVHRVARTHTSRVMRDKQVWVSVPPLW